VRHGPDVRIVLGRQAEQVGVQTGLSNVQRHELWRLQLLDELYGKLRAIEAQPALDPKGTRRAALHGLIARFEQIEVEELRSNRSA